MSVSVAPKVIITLLNRTAILGGSAVFECRVQLGIPRARLHWHVGDGELPGTNEKYRVSYDDVSEVARLEILRCATSDAGRYGFIAVNQAGEASSDANLEVVG